MPSPFADKEIVLGVAGSIAAYKACELASQLVQAGARVTPVLTKHAQEFIGPASFEAITGQRAITEMFAPLQNPDVEHIAVAQRADLFLIAPATANVLAKTAHGIADDWLSTTLLATRAPILFAPAMNTHMYEHPATQENIAILQKRGCRFVGPGVGKLACGAVGAGRLVELSAILETTALALHQTQDLAGKQVLITSGPTHEPIDPVRFISNHSSGKMGYAVAMEALRRGANVTVLSGPAETPLPHWAKVLRVKTAMEMLEAVREQLHTADIFIGAAAVGDYRVAEPAAEKHKRETNASYTLSLTNNPDIAAFVGQHKKKHQLAIGFAAETSDVLSHAQEKCERKALDLIVANQVGGDACAFGSDTVSAAILPCDTALRSYEKTALTQRLFDEIIARLPQSQ